MPDIQSIEISKKLKEHFKISGITQREIASRLGISQAAVSCMLNGKPFGKKSSKRWGIEFDIRPNWLLTGEGDMLDIDKQNSVGDITQEYKSVDALNRAFDNMVKTNDRLTRENERLIQENIRLREENESIKQKNATRQNH